MPWFKIDDKHHDHKKTRKALRGVSGKRRDAGAMGIWELAGSWSADNLMDGFVPTDELFRWDDDWEALATRLVAAGFWVESEHDGEPGYQFVNWDEHQPMKSEVEAKREAARERMRQIRSGSRSGSRERSTEVRANEQENEQEKFAAGSPTPSRPVPSRPDPKEEVADGGSKRGASRKRPAKRLPDDWEPSAKAVAHCAEKGIDLAGEAERFRLHAEANDRRQANWDASFRMWLSNARPSNVHQLTQKQQDAGWFQPFTMPPAPRDVEDDPEAYEVWAEGRRQAWRNGERW